MIKKAKYVVALIVGFALFAGITLMPDVDAKSDVAAKKTFVGSAACKTCHSQTYKAWEKTAHTKKTQPATKKTVVMKVDNKEQLTPDGKVRFKLQWKGRKKLMLTLYNLDGTGAVTYQVNRVMGGFGKVGKQRLVIQFDKDGVNAAGVADGHVTHLISPVQYNHHQDPKVFNAYHPEHWYTDTDNDGTMETLITNDEGITPANVVSASQFGNSWERRCIGCHATGPAVDWNKRTNFFANQSSEYNVGCEACHGPGSAHVASLSKKDILNPDDIDDHKIATDVCARCHIRGANINKGSGPFDTGYPSKVKKTGRILFMKAGDDLKKWYTPGEGKWGSDDSKWKKDASEYNFSKKHHQQGSDWVATDADGNALNKHFGDAFWQKKTCWECHTPHSKGVEAPQLYRKASDNDLCLSCHAGHGFANDEEIMFHTQHSIDPKGIGTSRCVTCHMPRTAKSQAGWDAQGGDTHSHVFEVVKPSLTKKMAKKNKGNVADGSAIPNGCIDCHTSTSDYSTGLWKAWIKAGGGHIIGEH